MQTASLLRLTVILLVDRRHRKVALRCLQRDTAGTDATQLFPMPTPLPLDVAPIQNVRGTGEREEEDGTNLGCSKFL